MMFQSPQWGSNSKVTGFSSRLLTKRFSPRNGEVILKVGDSISNYIESCGFSPRNGEVILKGVKHYPSMYLCAFQSPQWGSNSKGRL